MTGDGDFSAAAGARDGLPRPLRGLAIVTSVRTTMNETNLSVIRLAGDAGCQLPFQGSLSLRRGRGGKPYLFSAQDLGVLLSFSR